MELRECPFCGAGKADWACPRDYEFFVYCCICEAEGPRLASLEDATGAWNRRAADRYELTDKGRELLGGGE